MLTAAKVDFALIVWFIACVNGHLPVHNPQVTLSCGSGNDVQENQIQSGPPGKRGPIGPQGPKGESGSCIKNCENIDERLTVLENKVLEPNGGELLNGNFAACFQSFFSLFVITTYKTNYKLVYVLPDQLQYIKV